MDACDHTTVDLDKTELAPAQINAECREKALGFVVYIAGRFDTWPKELAEVVRELGPAERRRVFVFAATCAEIGANSAEEAADYAHKEATRIRGDLAPVARRLLSVPAEKRTSEWLGDARRLAAVVRSVDALPQPHARDARRMRVLSRELRAPARFDSTPRARRPRVQRGARRGNRARRAAHRGATRAGPSDDEECDPAGLVERAVSARDGGRR